MFNLRPLDNTLNVQGIYPHINIAAKCIPLSTRRAMGFVSCMNEQFSYGLATTEQRKMKQLLSVLTDPFRLQSMPFQHTHVRT